MTSRPAAERRLGAQHAAALALAESASLSDAAPRILRAICESLGWDHGALWEVAAGANFLKCVQTWHTPGLKLDNFDEVSRTLKFAPGIGLPGRVWESGKATWIEDVVEDPNFPRAKIARAEGLHGAFGFPVVIGTHVLGVIEFFSREIQEPDEALLEMLGTVGSQIGQFIERKRAETELDKFFSMSLDLLCIAGNDGFFKRLNPAWEKTLGYTREELLSRPWADFIHGDDRAASGDAAAGLEKGQDLVSFENRFLCRDGSYRWILWTATFDTTGQRIFAIGHDVTEAKRAQEAKEETAARLLQLVKELDVARHRAEGAARVKSDFLANMSHEIRTPMNAVMGMTDLALATELSTEQRGYLRTVKDAAKALLDLVDDILDLSKIEAGKLELDRVEMSFRETVEDAIKVLALRAGQKGLELAVRISPELPSIVLGDPGRLRQVVVNLVGNAIKFTDHGEVVLDAEVDVKHEDEVRVRVAVRDTGIGVPAEKRDQIFAPFTQADTSTTRRFGGTGLGLAISTQLVEMMGGHLTMESEVGRGSTFSFTARFELPYRETAPAAVPAGTDLTGLSVLVVDDNETNRRILVEMLTSWRMHPAAAASGVEALRLLRDAREAGRAFSLAITDGQMPEMDGFMLAEAVKADPALRAIPMILLTSAGRAGDAARCRRLGIAGFLMKPVKQSDLLDAMAIVLGGDVMGASREVAPKRATARRLKILLAEDNPVNQQVASRILERRGHAVVVVGDGKAAVEALRGAHGFDAVLMDVQMPEMDGLTATGAIREHERTAGGHVPIIAMTAHAMEGDRERCVQAGMDGYVSKPVEADHLIESVETAAGAFDPSRAAARLGGDAKLLRELLDLFLSDLPRMTGEIERAIATKDAEALRHAAHALKGSVANFAAAGPVDAARKLEAIGASGDLARAKDAYAELSAALTTFTKGASKGRVR
jgi:PAS domain S-box-containing protein